MADRQSSMGGMVTEYCDLLLRFDDHYEKITFDITPLGSHQAILGYRWLKIHNPDVDWSGGILSFSRCPRECLHSQIKELRFIWNQYTKWETGEMDDLVEEFLSLPREG